MNFLWCLLILSALASLLVTGPNLVPVQAYATVDGDNIDDNKITKDYKNSIHIDISSKSDSTDQQVDQDNLCYRASGCKQANEDQQLAGKDNAASGFNDQSTNVSSLFGTATASPLFGATGPAGVDGTQVPPEPPGPLQPSFSSPVHLDNSTGDQTDPHIASSGSSVYAVWTNEVNGQSGILFARSTDSGAHFSTPTPLSDPTTSFSFLPDVAVDKNNNNNVYVVWTRVTTESEIILVKSTDGGVSFGPPIELNPGVFDNARAGVVAVAGDGVYETWQDFRVSTSTLDPEIFFRASSDGGATFGSQTNISNTPILSRNPSIAAYENNVYVTWAECNTNGTNCKILYTKSSNAGLDFTSPVAITGPESSLPDIKVLENNVYVVYGQAYPVNSVTHRDVFLLKSTDGGQSFGGPVNLSVGIPNSVSIHPNIDVSDDNVVITWELRFPSSANPHWEVFFVGSIDAGNTFSDPISLSSSLGNRDATLNDVAISGTNVYSTWTTFENGSSNIYFAKGNLGSP